MKKISAVVVNWNGKDVLADCLESLMTQDAPNLEIIVSDNGSGDGSLEMLRDRFPRIRCVENGANLGFGTAVNRGLAVAEGDYLLFLNNDLAFEPGAVRALADLLDSHPEAGAAVPKILYYEKRDTINSYGVRVHYTGVAYPNRLNERDDPNLDITETACGGIFMFRREVYETLGGFDEDFFLYHEDHDLSWRIRLAGWKILVTPRAVFYHHYHFNKGVRKFYHSEKNRLHLLLKNMEGKTLLLLLPGLILVETAQWIHAALNGWFFLKVKSYIELAEAFPSILKKRRKLKRLRKVRDRDLLTLHQGTLAVSGMRSLLVDTLLNPILDLWWRFIGPRI
ncbi:MAG: hypothetical protein COV67_10265 [Nitrospinae bacterium CG11_big_fil_rev_8_21_14_0_20_56_8]|nr:MAG: hypothetical protein COV67_10265 [Nitrospinae bacterium CG11_big_fil_rev_8_21_14_0_20_56_8]